MPFYFGVAVTAEPLVGAVLGWRWIEAAPLVPALAMAMPFMTLQILFGPATNAIGRPGLQLRVGAIGAVLMTAAFFVGIRWGAAGLAWAWLGGMATLLVATMLTSLPAIGARKRDFVAAAAPGVVAAAAMAVLVAGFDRLLPPLDELARLGLLAAFGAAAYAALLLLFARRTVDEMMALLRPGTAAALN